MLVNDNLSAFFVCMYLNNNSSLSFLLEGYVPKNIFLCNYRLFIKENGLVPIEELLIEEKVKLWEEVKSIGISKENVVDAAKILHTLKFINDNS